MTGQAAALVDRGRRALDACNWTAASDAFEQARASEESAEVLDGLGEARYWQGAYAESAALRERAYALYRRRGDRPDAARVAVHLAQLHGLVYGNAAAVSGWIGHAQRMLADCDVCVVHGLVELFLGAVASDPDERERRARAAVGIGRRFDAPGLEHDALGYVGKAHIERGAVADGMRLIDEAVAAVASGLVSDAWAAGSIWCSLFHACEMAIDVGRAEQWLGAVDHYVERTDELPISAICRMHYGGLLTSAGRWVDAERELQIALSIYDDTYRGTRFEPLLRLAELRARQGRIEEAARLIGGYEDHPLAVLPRARVLLARDAPDHARAVLDRHLPRGTCDLPAAPGVALAVDVALACGAVDQARERTDQLEALADSCGVPSVRGFAARARAGIAAATAGQAAAAHLEEALVAFADGGMAHDIAGTRLQLATLLADERPQVATGEARSALEGFQAIGAVRGADAAAQLLRRLGETGPARPPVDGVLTARQHEVLDLVAEGLSNADIAERLFISRRTVEHHVSSILSALQVRTRAEAAARALRGIRT
ncbi:MAG TPA: LuxR C-terminal-related transcriptional regulator [Euzebyales bacterium]